MSKPWNTLAARLALGLALLGAATPALAQGAWPERPVRIIMPFAAGGGADIVARLFASCLSPRLGQPVVVENRVGAGGTIGAEAAAKSAPDGYTVVMHTVSSAVLNGLLYRSLPYDWRRDFVAVSQVALSANVLIVRRDLPAENLRELAALLKRQPGRYSYGSSGNGTILHLSGVLFARMAGVEITHVPYRGSSQAMNDLLAGQLDMAFDIPAGVVQQVQAGQVRALGVTTRHPSHALPGVPTIAEGLLPGYETFIWHGIFAPSATPRAVVEKLGAASQAAVRDADCNRRLTEAGVEPVGSSPDEFTRFWEEQIRHWEPIVRAANVRLE